MSRSTVYAILAVLGGPAVAFLTMAIGCVQPWQLLDSMCGHNGYISLMLFMLAAWAVFTVLYFVHFLRQMFK